MQTSYVATDCDQMDAAPDHPQPLVPALRVPENDRTAFIAPLDSVRRQSHHFGSCFGDEMDDLRGRSGVDGGQA